MLTDACVLAFKAIENTGQKSNPTPKGNKLLSNTLSFSCYLIELIMIMIHLQAVLNRVHYLMKR